MRRKTIACLAMVLALLLGTTGCSFAAGGGSRWTEVFRGLFSRKGEAPSAPVADEKGPTTEYGFQTRRDGFTIRGRIHFPATGKAPYPTVVLCHGFGSDMRDAEAYAKRLAQNGIAGCIFDFVGGGPESTSDGTGKDMSVLTEQKDLEAVLKTIGYNGMVDRDHLFLMGMSQGGFVAAMEAAQRTDIRGLILLYPAFRLHDDAIDTIGKDGSQMPEELPPVMGYEVGKDYLLDLIQTDPWQTIGTYSGDVLILQGTEDQLVPPKESRKAKKAYASARLVELEGAGHGFSGAAWEDAVNEMIAFVRAHG